jgi:FHS family L-fucose permease-like MFS transporter
MLRKYRVETVLALCGVSATALLTVSVLSSGYIAIVSVLAIGLCNAMIVPVVVMLSISGLGEKAAKASSVMTAANIGGGLMPLAMGALADRIGLHYAFLLPVVSYLCVVFYALYGASSRNLKLV